ncbi:MAG: ArnT family glycosyltransferase, partial [Mangrovibacterium sp.]
MKNKFLIISLLFLVFYVFAFQGSRGIFESTEGRYANVAYVMLKTGDWVHPKLNIEQPHWTKPPMYYWTTALSMKMFGLNTFAVRFVGAFAFLLSILLVFQLGKIFVPQRPWLAGIIYATCIMPFGASNAVSTDGLLGLFETAAMT